MFYISKDGLFVYYHRGGVYIKHNPWKPRLLQISFILECDIDKSIILEKDYE